jgi:hypothetical protein
MKLARGWSCLILLVALLDLSGCNWIKKIGGGGGVAPQVLGTGGVTKIEITGCKITPAIEKEIIRPKGDVIKWYTKDTDTYTITFLPKYNPPGNNITPFPPTHTLTVAAGTPATWDLSFLDAGHTSTPTDCAGDSIPLPHITIPSCYYEYTIVNSKNQSCDPGVHVIPDGP